MPFVLRQVTPVRLSRRPSSSASTGVCCDDGGDDDARQVVTNRTLSACLRQLASLVSLAGDIFGQCQAEAQALNERTQQLRKRLDTVQSAVDALDSRTVEIRKFFFSFLISFIGFSSCCSFELLELDRVWTPKATAFTNTKHCQDFTLRLFSVQ